MKITIELQINNHKVKCDMYCVYCEGLRYCETGKKRMINYRKNMRYE
jgi:hypothetical protein